MLGLGAGFLFVIRPWNTITNSPDWLGFQMNFGFIAPQLKQIERWSVVGGVGFNLPLVQKDKINELSVGINFWLQYDLDDKEPAFLMALSTNLFKLGK